MPPYLRIKRASLSSVTGRIAAGSTPCCKRSIRFVGSAVVHCPCKSGHRGFALPRTVGGWRLLNQQLWEQAGQLRQQVLNRFGVGEPDTFQLAVVPAAIHRITRLPASRRREFRDYLKPLIDRAVALPAVPVVEPDSTMESTSMQETRLSAASGSACACCQGYCCRGGAYTHAYLGVETLQRYVAARPDQPPDQILAAYLRYIGKETSEGSCVYQRADGCSLPREMRATICNNFYCGGLREFRAKVPATGPVRGFFVAMTDNEICRAALVDEEQMLMMSAPPAPRD